MSIERGLGQQETSEQKPESSVSERQTSPEIIRNLKTWKDKKGDPICETESVLDGEPCIVNNIVGKANKLKSLILRGQKDGKPFEIDVLAMTGAAGESPTVSGIYVAEKRQQNHYFSNESKSVTSPPLETPADLGILLHELGHAKQATEDRFQEIGKQYGRSIQEMESPEQRQAILESWKKSMPDLDIVQLETRITVWDMLRAKVVEEQKKQSLAKEAVATIKSELDSKRFESLMRDPSFQSFYKDLEALRAGSSSEAIDVFYKKHGVMFESLGRPFPFEFPGVTPRGTKLSEAEKATLESREGITSLFGVLSRPSFYAAPGFEPQAKLLPSELAVKFQLMVTEQNEETGIKIAERELVMRLPLKSEGAIAATPEETTLNEKWIIAQAKEAEQMKQTAEATSTMFGYLSETGLLGTLDLPRKLLERDANAKAMIWLRKLQQQGVDLFKAAPAEESPIVPCGTTGPESWTAPGFVRHSVRSYKATPGEMRKAKGKAQYKTTNAPDEKSSEASLDQGFVG